MSKGVIIFWFIFAWIIGIFTGVCMGINMGRNYVCTQICFKEKSKNLKYEAGWNIDKHKCECLEILESKSFL